MSDASSEMSSDEIYIIEEHEQKIPWGNLSDEERYKILIRELAEHVVAFPDDFIKNVSDLMGRSTYIDANPWNSIYRKPWNKPNVDGSSGFVYRTCVSKYLGGKVNVLLENETVSIVSLESNLRNIGRLGYNVVDYDKNLNFHKVFKRQWRYGFGNTVKFNSNSLRMLSNLNYNIEDYFRQTDHNSVKFDERQLILAKQRLAGISSVKEVFSKVLGDDRIEFSKDDELIYGKYYNYNTLSDFNVGRMMFLAGNVNLRNALPYFLTKSSQFKRYRDLVAIKKDLRVLLDVQNAKNEIRAVNIDILEQAISSQLGPYILEKYQNKKLTLTDSQLRIVKRFIELQKDLRIKYKKNTCPHLELRRQFEATLNIKEKSSIFGEMNRRFGNNGFDPETRFLFCSNCGFNMGCQHEVLIFIEITKSLEVIKDYYKMGDVVIECRYCGRKIKDAIIDKEVEFDDDNRRVVGNITEKETDDTIFLRNRINEILTYAGVSNKINPFVILATIAGIVFEKFGDIMKKGYSTDRAMALKKIQSYAYTWAYLTEHEYLKIGMFRVLGKREDRANSEDRQDLKDLRKIIYKKMNERDPKFIIELENLDLRANFVNAITKAQVILKKNDFKNYKSIITAKKLFGYTLPLYLDFVKPIKIVKEMVKSNREYLVQVFRGITPLQNRKYFKEHYPNVLVVKSSGKYDLENLEDEIKVFLESACAGITGELKVQWHRVDINCRAVDKTSSKIASNLIEKSKKNKIQKINDEKFKIKFEKKKESSSLVGDVVKLDKLLHYFGTNIGIVRNFVKSMSGLQYIEVKNIIARLVREYRRIHNNDFPNSPSTKYLEQFESKDFGVKLTVDRKDNFVDILLTIVKNKDVADYIIELIRSIEFSISLGQMSNEEMLNMEEEITVQRKKNWDFYGKMTPEQKLEADFGGKNLEEQIEIITRKQIENEELQLQNINNINDNPDFVKMEEMELDDLQSFDGEVAYNSGSFEIF